MRRVGIISLLAAMFVMAFLQSSRAQIPTHFGATRAPALAVDKSDKVYLTMSVATKPASAMTPGSQIFFTLSSDGGNNWNNLPFTKNLSKSKGEAFGSAIAINQQGTTRAYVVYHDDTQGASQAYLVSTKKKAKFKKAQNITPIGAAAFSPRIALDSSEALNVVWGDTETGNRRVIFTRSTDLGATFSESRDISQSEGAAFEPEICVDQTDAINVVWEDTAAGNSAIMFARSVDNGLTFSAPLAISDPTRRAIEAHIAVDRGNGIHVIWTDEVEEDSQIFYARSTDGGQGFSAPVNISNDEGRQARKPYITTFGNTIYIAYHTERTTRKQVFLHRSTDGGASFEDREQVSRADNSRGRAHSVAMAADSTGKLHLAWIDTSPVHNDEGVLFYCSTRNGHSFTQSQIIFAALP